MKTRKKFSPLYRVDDILTHEYSFDSSENLIDEMDFKVREKRIVPERYPKVIASFRGRVRGTSFTKEGIIQPRNIQSEGRGYVWR